MTTDDARDIARVAVIAGVIWLVWRFSRYGLGLPGPGGSTPAGGGGKEGTAPNAPKRIPAKTGPDPASIRWFGRDELAKDTRPALERGDAAIRTFEAPVPPSVQTRPDVERYLENVRRQIELTLYGATGQRMRAAALGQGPRTTAMYPGGPEQRTITIQVQVRDATAPEVAPLHRLAEKAASDVYQREAPSGHTWWVEPMYSGVVRALPVPVGR